MGARLLWALTFAGCTWSTGPVQPDDVTPPPPAPVEQDDCEAASARLKELECRSPAGTPRWQTPEGTSFADACEAAANDGRDWNPRCIARIADCSQLNAAFRGEYCPR